MYRVAFLLVAALLSDSALSAIDPPQQIHLAFAGRDANGHSNGMSVTWVTLHPTQTSVVRYGLSPNALTNVAYGTNSSYYQTWFDFD